MGPYEWGLFGRYEKASFDGECPCGEPCRCVHGRTVDWFGPCIKAPALARYFPGKEVAKQEPPSHDPQYGGSRRAMRSLGHYGWRASPVHWAIVQLEAPLWQGLHMPNQDEG